MQPVSGAPGRVRQAVKIVVGVALLGYPVAIYYAHDHLTPAQLLAGLLILLAVRALVSAWVVRRRVRQQGLLAAALGAGAVLVLAVFGDVRMDWLRFYPMLFDLGVAAAFFGSLFTARPLVERIARVFHPDLPPSGVRYTRHVTQAWGTLMVLVALVSLYTALAAPLRTWSLFNGLIVYGVIALAFACEYLVRRRVKRHWEAA